MTIKHPNVLTDKTVNTADGVKDVQVDNMTPGTYKVDVDTATAGQDAIITGSYGFYDTKTTGTTERTTTITPTALSGMATGVNVVRVEIYEGNDMIYEDGDGSTTLIARNAPADTISEYFETNVVGTLTGTGVSVTVTGVDDDNDANTGSTSGFESYQFDVTRTNSGHTDSGGVTVKFYTAYDATAGTSTEQTYSPTTTVGNETDNSTTTIDTSVKKSASDFFTVTSNNTNTLNGSVLFEVQNRDTENDTVTLKATATLLDQDGKNSTSTMDNIVIKENGTADLGDIFGAGNVTLALNNTVDAIGDNGKFVAFVTAGVDSAAADKTSLNLKLSGEIDDEWDDTWDNGPFGVDANSDPNELNYLVNADSLTDSEVHLKNFILNEKTGTVTEGDVIMSTDKNFTSAKLGTDTTANATGPVASGDTLAAFTTAYIGKTANGDVKLRDLDKFWNSEGKFMLDDAKTLTLNQGNGNTASITLYANDTLDEVATKINNAIATDLGQSKYVDDATKFATFVSEDGANNFASEAVPGTFIIRSVVPGNQGEITFSGDQEILDALSLNTIQESKETRYSVDVLDEHSGKVLAQNVKTTGNVLHGIIHENVDVEFSALSGISATWNDNLKKFTYESEMEESTLHLADNTTVLQIGANEGEDLAMDIGDMRSHALGLDGVNMMSHDRAARSITIIDNAIDRVSTQRAKLGAYQNRLEYTASNLTTASENLTSAESRIRDADMAKEMMNFTKLNIMLQAGNSMLAQANQQPQNVLSLIR